MPENTGTTEDLIIKHGEYLSNYWQSLPAGRIDKSFPGIGATTLEIKDKSRNSIIVFPTRSLAALKAEKHGMYYFGSRFQNISSSNFEDVKSALKNGTLVKIAVVADSLPKIFHDLKKENLSSQFFLMIDEIDSFQTESNYRPALENCIDIYFDFPTERRCLITATMNFFSNNKIKNEKLYI